MGRPNPKCPVTGPHFHAGNMRQRRCEPKRPRSQIRLIYRPQDQATRRPLPMTTDKMPSLRQSSKTMLTQFLFTLLLLNVGITKIHAAEDFYKLLGISRSATQKEIKKAYRSKSLEFHPDKNKSEGAAEKFAEIAYAYEVLTDEEKKGIYDRHGEEGLKQHEQRQGQG